MKSKSNKPHEEKKKMEIHKKSLGTKGDERGTQGSNKEAMPARRRK